VLVLVALPLIPARPPRPKNQGSNCSVIDFERTFVNTQGSEQSFKNFPSLWTQTFFLTRHHATDSQKSRCDTTSEMNDAGQFQDI
jgi:hypothetical protein